MDHRPSKSRKKESGEMCDKGDYYVRLFTLSPFLFAYSELDAKWLNILRVSGLLVKRSREESTEQLTDRELAIVDILEASLNHVLQYLESSQRQKDEQMLEVFALYTRCDREDMSYGELLKNASNIGFFQDIWKKFKDEVGIFSEHHKFSVVFVLRQYYNYIQTKDLIKLTERRLAEEEKKAETFKTQGNKDFKEARYADAVRNYTRAIELCHFNHIMYGNRAQAFLKLDRYREALSDARRAVALKPKWIKGLYRLAEACIGLRMFDRAKKANTDGIFYAEEEENGKDADNLKIQKARLIEKMAESDDPEENNSDVPELVSSEDSDSGDEDLTEDGPGNEKTEAEFREIRLELNRCLLEGSNYYLNNKFVLAARQFHRSLELIGQHGLKFLDVDEVQELTIRYVYGLACVGTTNSKWLRAGVKCLDGCVQSKSTTSLHIPVLLHGLGLSHLALFRFREAGRCVETALDKVTALGEPGKLKWPGKEMTIDVTRPGKLTVALTELLTECRFPPRPDATCRYHHSADKDTVLHVYFDDPDFKGMTRMCCWENCRIEFHPKCWKEFKLSRGDRVVDRDVLDINCLTPDCAATICKVIIFRPENMPDGKLIESDSQRPVLPKLVKPIQKMVKVSARRIEQKQQKKERRRELRLLAAETESDAADKENSAVKEENVGVVSDDRGRTSGADDGVKIWRKEDPEIDSKPSKTKSKQKNKKRKDKTLLPVEVNFGDSPGANEYDYDYYTDEAEDYSSPFRVPASLQGEITSFNDSSIWQSDNQSGDSTVQSIKNNLISYFTDYFLANGSQPLSSRPLREEVDGFPEEAKKVIEDCGGIRGLLLGSLKFRCDDGVLSLIADKTMSRDSLSAWNTKVKKSTFAFNPKAPEFKPGNLNRLSSPTSYGASEVNSSSFGDHCDSLYEKAQNNVSFRPQMKGDSYTEESSAYMSRQPSSAMGLDDFSEPTGSRKMLNDLESDRYRSDVLGENVQVTTADSSNKATFEDSKTEEAIVTPPLRQSPLSIPNIGGFKPLTLIKARTGPPSSASSVMSDMDSMDDIAVVADTEVSSLTSKPNLLTGWSSQPTNVWSSIDDSDIPPAQKSNILGQNGFIFSNPKSSTVTANSIGSPVPFPFSPSMPNLPVIPPTGLSTFPPMPLCLDGERKPLFLPRTAQNASPMLSAGNMTGQPLSSVLVGGKTSCNTQTDGFEQSDKCVNTDPFKDYEQEHLSAQARIHSLETQLSETQLFNQRLHTTATSQIQQLTVLLETERSNTVALKEDLERVQSHRETLERQFLEEKTALLRNSQALQQKVVDLEQKNEKLQLVAADQERSLTGEVHKVKEELVSCMNDNGRIKAEAAGVEERFRSQTNRAKNAEMQVLKVRCDSSVALLERRLEELKYCYTQLEKQSRSGGVSSAQAKDQLEMFIRGIQHCSQLIAQTKDQFAAQLRKVEEGHELADLPPLRVPSPPAAPPMMLGFSPAAFTQTNGHPRVSSPVVSSPVPLTSPSAASSMQAAAPLKPLTGISPFPTSNKTLPATTVSQPAPMRPLTRSAAAPLSLPRPPHHVSRPLNRIAPPNPESANAKPVANIVQPPKNSFEKLIIRLQALFPKLSRPQFTEQIQELRNECGGSLSGMSVDQIIERVAEKVLLLERQLSRAKSQPPSRILSPPPGLSAEWACQPNGASDRDEDVTCAICHDDMMPTTAVTLSCRHRFHDKCIKMWFKEQSTCPNCRTYALLQDEFPSLH